MKVTTCKSCGAPIVWIKTQNGRSMPCDVPAVDYQENYKGSSLIVTDDGRVRRATIIKKTDNLVGLATRNKRQRLHIALCNLPVRKRT